MLELEKLIEDKSFALHPCQGAPMVIKVEDLLDWLINSATAQEEDYQFQKQHPTFYPTLA